MTSLSLILGSSHIFIALVIILISIPLVKEKIPMNTWYGVRFNKSYGSDENWYRINRYGGRQLIIWSVVLAFLGIVTIFLPIDQNSILFFPGLLAPLIIFAPAVTSYMYARKL
jgi:hypothetical protein